MPVETKIKKPSPSEALRRLLSARTKALFEPDWGLSGTFRTDSKNRLIYSLQPASPAKDPSQVALEGAWRLKSDQELQFVFKSTRKSGFETLVFKGALAAAGANQLSFAFAEDKSQTLTLSGRWMADSRNRLAFAVEKANGAEDRLTLRGAWEIGPHHELRYQTVSGRGKQKESFLVFEGAWQVSSSNQLVYKLSGSSESVFAFQASLVRSLVMAGDGELAYDVGIGLSSTKTRKQRISLFGSWKLNRGLSVSFEVPYANGRVESLRFEGVASVSPQDRIAVALSTSRREKLGLTVVFTKDLFRDTQLFLRLKRDAGESSVVGGLRVRF